MMHNVCSRFKIAVKVSKVDIKYMAMKLRIKDIKQKKNVKMQLL